ncbi:MAG: hypothetical protein Kow0045_13630 [Albidovulum sp.]
MSNTRKARSSRFRARAPEGRGGLFAFDRIAIDRIDRGRAGARPFALERPRFARQLQAASAASAASPAARLITRLQPMR